MDLLGPYDLDAMNETDVREVLVRPLLTLLGYRQGTEANIRTETTLRYDRAFLGRKNSKKDPTLQGRADYICEVIPYARWVVEVKPPSGPLTMDDAHQAHTYAAHPEIAAAYYMLTNGREFRVYRTSFPDNALMAWEIERTEEVLPTLKGVLGPPAIKRLATVFMDLGKPLASSLPSSVEIVGGHVVYDRHVSDVELLNAQIIDGTRATIVGDHVKRNEDGLIEASVRVVSAFIALDVVNKAIGLDSYSFMTSDEFISEDVQQPSIFQNVVKITAPEGLRFPAGPHWPEFELPFSFDTTCYTEAVGFLANGRFQGTMAIDYYYAFSPSLIPFPIPLPRTAYMRGEGRFDLLVRRP